MGYGILETNTKQAIREEIKPAMTKKQYWDQKRMAKMNKKKKGKK